MRASYHGDGVVKGMVLQGFASLCMSWCGWDGHATFQTKYVKTHKAILQEMCFHQWFWCLQWILHYVFVYITTYIYIYTPLIIVDSRMRSKGSRFTLGVWGLRVCSLDVAFVVATVRNRPQPFATVRVRTVWPCLWEVLQRWSFLEVSDVWLLRFAWQAWHFVTFRRVLQRVESRFAWQAQYFCDVFRRCVAVFVAGAALWTRPSSFFVAGAAL